MKCAEGRYGGTLGAFTNDNCNAACSCVPGAYCPVGSSQSFSNCIACPAGYWCAGEGAVRVLCDTTKAYYCAPGTSDPFATECPAGRYGGNGNATGTLTAACSGRAICMAGYYCPAKSTSSVGLECPAGSYCTGGDALPLPCTVPGYACPRGQVTNSSNPCLAGRFGRVGDILLNTSCR
jgi:hypothetical protein